MKTCCDFKCHMSNIKRVFVLMTFLSCAITIITSCSDYNPFMDESNTRGVIKSSLKNGDTLEIFDTKSFEVIFLVRNLLEKCSLHVDKNRFFEDTCIDFSGSDPFKSSISFYDTGNHQIKLMSIRESGETIEQSINVYAVNPLSQSDIIANAGDSVRLKAIKGVMDTDVMYTWSFTGGMVVNQYGSADTKQKIRGTSGDDCFFTVSDSKGKRHSPTVRFSCILGDSKAPKITCVNETVNDTMVASEVDFYFIVKVEDDGGIVSVSNNMELADTAFAFDYSKEFIWIIKNVDTLSKPMQLNVVAEDRCSNISSETFWLRFDPDAKAVDLVSLKIISPTLTTVKRSPFFMSGDVVNYYSSKFDVLTIMVNGVQYDPWTFNDKLSGKWNFNVFINQKVNTINLLLKNIHGDIVTDSVFNVYYDPDFMDDVPPSLVELSVNGQTLTGKGELVLVDKTPVPLRIIAFDEGDGISTVMLNNNLIHKSDSVNYIWETDIRPTSEGNDFTIEINDLKHTTSKFFKVKLNYRPDLEVFQKNITVEIGKEYIDSIKASDEDNDAIIYKAHNEPNSFHIDSLTGKISWIPSIEDTNISEIILSYNDVYWKDMFCTLYVLVLDTNRTPKYISFATSEKDFPEELIVDSQVLDIQLKTIPDIDNNQLKYEIRKIPESSQIQIKDDRLYWAPGSNDTGLHKIIVSVTDTVSKTRATLVAMVNLIPKTAPATILLKYSGKTLPDSTYDLSDPSLTNTLSIYIIDPDLVISDDNKISITLSGITEYRSGKRADISLDAMKKETGYDTIFVSIADRYRSYERKKAIYYGTAPKKPIITEPSDGQMINNDECTFKWSGGDIDEVNELTYSLYLASGSDDFYLAESGLLDTQCTVRLNKTGLYNCKIVAFDGKASVESNIITIDAEPTNRVSFGNFLNEFPLFIETGDQWSIQLRPESGTGKRPFTYKVSSAWNVTPQITPDSSNQDYANLKWSPLPGDTGIYKLLLTICDSFSNIDMLEPTIRIVPPNRTALLVPLYGDSVLHVYESLQPETLSFRIEDLDDVTIEQYYIIIKMSTSEQILPVEREFSYIVKPKNGNLKEEMLVVEFYERGELNSVYKLRIYYND